MNVERITGMKNMVKRKGFVTFLKYVMAFLIPIIIFTIILYIQKAYPFGTRTFLYRDANYQYNVMFEELIRWLHNDDRSIILWDRGLGVDFFVNMLYYGMSPFNIIIILMGENRIALSMVIVIILKLATMCVTALYYFEHTSLIKNRKSQTVIRYGISYTCACAYVLCGYVLAYNHNPIWLDGLILLPLLAIALENLSAQSKGFMYYILLIMVFVANFYFSFYICMFAVVYFLILDRANVKQFIRQGLMFAGISVLAAMTAAIVLLPAMFAILNISSAGNEVNIGMLSIGNLWDFWESFYPLRALDGDGGFVFVNNNYCGTVILLLILFFYLSKEITVKRKIKFTVAMAFLVIGMNFSGLNYVMHGFAFTHGMGNRFAFIFLFLLITIACQVLSLSEHEPAYNLKALFGVAGIFLLFSISLAFNPDKGSPYSYIAFLMIMTVYTALLIFKWRKSIKSNTFYLWFIGLWLVELVVNAVMVAPDKSEDYSFEQKIHLDVWEQEYDNLVCELGERKSALYEEIYMSKSNVNWYSSMIDKSVIDSFQSMGMSYYHNIECTYRGTTRLTALMYNVRYVLSNEIGNLSGYHSVSEQDEYIVYEADVLAGMGFMVNEDIVNWSGLESAAYNQNSFIETGFHGQPLFSEVDISNADVTYDRMELISRDGMDFEYTGTDFLTSYVRIDFQADNDMDLYLESSDTSLQAVRLLVNGELRVDTTHPESGSLLHIGNVCEGDEISIRHFSAAAKNERAKKRIRIYSFDNTTFEEILPYILDEILLVDSIQGNNMEGHISAKEDGILYIALPYHQGYTIFVDGIEQQPLKIGTGLMGVEIQTGDHSICINYETPGYKIGMIISILSCLLSAAIFAVAHKKNVLQQM